MPVRSLAAVCLLALAACATASEARQEETPSAKESSAYTKAGESPAAPAVPANQPTLDPATFDAKGYAATFPRAPQCEQAARALQARNAEVAWMVLKACTEHRDFTILARLLDEVWTKDLQTRPEVSLMLAKIIARRGGDVTGDLAMLRQRRIPLFSLQAAMAEPDTYRGRMVLLRGKVTDHKSQGGKPVVTLSEIGLGSETRDVQVGMASNSSYSGSGSGSGRIESSRYGNTSVEGSGSYSSNGKYTTTRQLTENTTEETGREVLGRLTKADPFLENDREFVVLARFDGVRVTSRQEPIGDGDDDKPDTVAVVSVVAYFAPSALLIE